MGDLELPLAEATGLTSSANIAQVCIEQGPESEWYGSLVGSGETLYVDDMYFSTVGYVAPVEPVYTAIYTFDNPNPEPGNDPASVTLYNSDQDYSVYILGQDGASYIEVTVPSEEGTVDFSTIGMVDLRGTDGTVLFPGVVHHRCIRLYARLTIQIQNRAKILPQ